MMPGDPYIPQPSEPQPTDPTQPVQPFQPQPSEPGGGNIVIADLVADLDDPLTAIGFMKSGDFESELRKYAIPGGDVSIPSWGEIEVDLRKNSPKPYQTYKAPADDYRRPELRNSQGMSLSGGSQIPFLQNIRSRFLPPQQYPPVQQDFEQLSLNQVQIQTDLTNIQYEINRINSSLIQRTEFVNVQGQIEALQAQMNSMRSDHGALGVELSRIKADIAVLETKTIPTDVLDEMKLGITDVFDMMKITNHDTRYGLVDVINRIESNIAANALNAGDIGGYIGQLSGRTVSLRDTLDQLAQELKGVAVIAGAGVGLATVINEANRIADQKAREIMQNALSGIWDGTVYPQASSTWFEGQLAKFNVSTNPQLAGFSSIRDVFSSGGQIDTEKTSSASDLIRNRTNILSAMAKIPALEQAINEGLVSMIPEQGQFALTPAGLGAVLQQMGFPVNLDNTFNIMGLADQLSNTYPFSSLKPFFFNVGSARRKLLGNQDPNFVGPPEPSLKDRLSQMGAQEKGIVGGFREAQYVDEYQYPVEISWKPFGKDRRTRSRLFVHAGLPNTAMDLYSPIRNWIKGEVEPDLTYGGFAIEDLHEGVMGIIVSMVFDKTKEAITNKINSVAPGILGEGSDIQSGGIFSSVRSKQANSIMNEVDSILPTQSPAGWKPPSA